MDNTAIFGFILIAFLLVYSGHETLLKSHWNDKCPTCIQEHLHILQHSAPNTSGKLTAITDPLFNIREAAKNMLALEDHLEHVEKRCMQCIKKHFMLIEVFLDEAVGLDRYGRYSSILNGKTAELHDIIEDFVIRKDFKLTGQRIRDIRKYFVEASFEHV